MDFQDAVRRRRMVRRFAPEKIPDEVLISILETAQHAPSAGFAQGLEMVVLDDPGQLNSFWELVDPQSRKRGARRPNLDEKSDVQARMPSFEGDPPVVVIPYSGKLHYLERYSEPDKRAFGMGTEEGWPVPYWDIDAAMGVMLMLLAAVDEGVGGWFFGIFQGEDELTRWLGVPEGFRALGAVALGYPSAEERKRGTAVTRPRRPLKDVV
ncbi:MAG: nitroreductase family protein, partial [Actinomycetota bacterium]